MRMFCGTECHTATCNITISYESVWFVFGHCWLQSSFLQCISLNAADNDISDCTPAIHEGDLDAVLGS